MVDRILIKIEKPDVATIAAGKDTAPAIASRIHHHLERERIESPGEARLEDIRVETVKNDFDHASSVGSGARRPKKHF